VYREVVDFETDPARGLQVVFDVSAAIAVGIAILVAALLRGVDTGVEPKGAGRKEDTMDTTDDTSNAAPRSATPDTARAGAAPLTPDAASDHPFGPYAAQILGTEHWSLLATRLLIWNEAMSRATVFLTVLSASIIALALLADATGFGPQTTMLALVLLPVVLLLGIATYVRQVQINSEEFKLVLAMNRLRHAYLRIEPGLARYFSTGHHDDERGLVASYMLDHPSRRWLLVHFVINTPTIVATVDAALGLPLPCWSCRPPGRRRARWWPAGRWHSWRSGQG
jgi:hypothetical protein